MVSITGFVEKLFHDQLEKKIDILGLVESPKIRYPKILDLLYVYEFLRILRGVPHVNFL